jgi:hypothetical protein
MFGIHKVQWIFPLGQATSKRKQCKPSGWVSVLKKHYQKWEKMVAEKDKDGEPIYKGICVLPNVGEDQQAYRMSGFTGCDYAMRE